MNYAAEAVARSNVAEVARRAKAAARLLATIPGERRDAALKAAAYAIEQRRLEILIANHRDCEDAICALEAGQMSRTLFERLRISESGIAQMAAGVREVAALADPLNRKLAVTELDDGLTLHKESCPIGVLAEAVHSNQALISIWSDALTHFFDIPADAINLLNTRADVDEMLSCEEDIDLIIPRGSRDFVRYVAEHSRIPVLGHGEGICHVFIDSMADLEKALSIAFDSKVQYPAACNAMETLLVHKEVAGVFLPEMISRFQAAGVQVRGCPRTTKLDQAWGVVPASEDDWGTEYSDLIVSIKIVDNTDEAIKHINRYGSGHTEAIVTEDAHTASYFMERVDAAGVYHNASTRFADGFRYGFGAELGAMVTRSPAIRPESGLSSIAG